MDKAWRDGVLACAKTSLQLLASSADLQIRYYPSFVLVPDELALDFDHWQSVFLSNFATELTAEQARAFTAINDRLHALSRGGSDFNGQLWTEDGLRNSAEWASIRRMASQVLNLMGWPVEKPDLNLGVY